MVFEKQDHQLVGILSIVDLLAAIRPEYLSAPKPSMADSMQYSTMYWSGLFTQRTRRLAKKKVSEIMSDCPPKVSSEANLMEVAELMFKEKARRLVVMANNKVAGIVREQEMFFEIAQIMAVS